MTVSIRRIISEKPCHDIELRPISEVGSGRRPLTEGSLPPMPSPCKRAQQECLQWAIKGSLQEGHLIRAYELTARIESRKDRDHLYHHLLNRYLTHFQGGSAVQVLEKMTHETREHLLAQVVPTIIAIVLTNKLTPILRESVLLKYRMRNDWPRPVSTPPKTTVSFA